MPRCCSTSINGSHLAERLHSKQHNKKATFHKLQFSYLYFLDGLKDELWCFLFITLNR